MHLHASVQCSAAGDIKACRGLWHHSRSRQQQRHLAYVDQYLCTRCLSLLLFFDPCLLFLRREPVKSEGPLPVHLIEPLKRSLTEDKFVADEGNIVFYQKASELQAEPARR
jgi:hypothetical protein